MAGKIIVSIDGFSAADKQRILQAAKGCEVEFVPESHQWQGELNDAEVAFGLPPVELIEQSSLRYLQLHSSGFDQYKTQKLLANTNLIIANARGVTAQAVAEQCLAMMFALTRRFPEQLRRQMSREWKRASSYEVLHSETIAIVGMGAIGSALGAMCRGIGMRVLSVQRGTQQRDFVAQTFPMTAIKEALAQARHVALALPAIPLGKPLIGAEELYAMPEGSYIYSMSRASLLNYDAMLAALDSGKLAGAGLDVFPVEPLPADSPLWDREDVLIAPHSGGRFKGEMSALAALFADNLSRYLSGGSLHNVVIAPRKNEV